MAYHDSLTGLPNRRHFMNTARRVLVEAYGKDRLAALFFIDLDKFKEVNDTYGHAAGDIEAHVSASIGIARYPTDARTVDDLVQLADAAMYVAKQNGRGRYVVTNGKKTEEA